MSVFVYLIRKYFSIPTPGGTASGRERLVDIIIKSSIPKLREKLLEALQAVLPIAAIVLVLCFSIAPVSPSILLCFLLGAAMIIVGIMFFTLGAEMSMTPMGERVGSMLTRSQNLFLIIGVGFLLGFLITISEPDLQVLANQVPSIPNMTLILSVAAGVGIFLVMAFLRMLLGIPLPRLLVIFYAAIFLLAAFVPKEFLAVAFDSGGVTTGPMTVPFIMALGVGVSAIRSDRHAADDSFGLVALCSVGPILAVLILGIVFNASESSYVPPVIPEVGDSVELWQLFSEGLPTYLHEIATSLLPIVVMFGIFQLAALHIDRRTLGRIGIAAVYGTQRVCAHIPDSGTVGGDGVPDAGQLRHQRRQAGKGPPGAGQHDDPAPDGIGNGLPGAGGDLALGIEQGAVQIKGDKTDRGRR